IHTASSSSSFASITFMMKTGQTVDSILLQPIPVGFTPNGNGGWYCAKHSDFTKHSVKITIDPNILFNESQVSPELASQVAQSIKPLCIKFWNKQCEKEIQRKAVNLCQTQLIQEDGTPFDISSLINIPFGKAVEFIVGLNVSVSSVSLNPFSNIENSPFLPDSAREPVELKESIFGGLVQQFIGRALIQSNRDFSKDEFQEFLWSPLEKVKTCPETHKNDKYDFYRAFIWSDLFKSEIERFCNEWIECHPDWKRPLRDLVVIPPETPRKLEQLTYNHSESEYKENGHSDDGLNIYITPYERSLDQLGYHDDMDDSWDDDDQEDEDIFNESEYRESLAELIECGEIEEDDIEDLVEEAREEAYEEADELKKERERNRPFITPFVIEHMAIDRTNKCGETEFCFYGHFFSDLDSVYSLGHHADLMDSLGKDLNRLSMFVRKGRSDFEEEYANVFYITEFILTNSASVNEMTKELERAFRLVGRDLSECVIIINSEALSDHYYIGAPYDSCLVLKNQYETYVNELIESLELYSQSVKYFSVK
ncbi:hypothetical protein REH81_10270, partial [Vibrio rotiferianus]